MKNAFVYGAFIGSLFFLFPIFLNVDAYTDLNENKVFFSLHIFKFIKIIGGYIVVQSKGLVFHISEKKALFLNYENMQNERKKFEITAGFQLYTLRTSLELGDEQFPAAGLYTALFSQLLSQVFYPWITFRKRFINLKNGTLLLHGGNSVKATVHVVTVFNQLTIGIALFKIILEAIINLWQKMKSTKQSRV